MKNLFFFSLLLCSSANAHAHFVDPFTAEMKIDSKLNLQSMEAESRCYAPKPSCCEEACGGLANPMRFEEVLGHNEWFSVQKTENGSTKIALLHYLSGAQLFSPPGTVCQLYFKMKFRNAQNGETYEGKFISPSTDAAELAHYFSGFDIGLDPVLHETTQTEFQEVHVVDRTHQNLDILLSQSGRNRVLVGCELEASSGNVRSLLADFDLSQSEKYRSIDLNQSTEIVGRIDGGKAVESAFDLGLREKSNQLVWAWQAGPHVELREPDQTLISCNRQVMEESIDLNTISGSARAQYYLKALLRP